MPGEREIEKEEKETERTVLLAPSEINTTLKYFPHHETGPRSP